MGILNIITLLGGLALFLYGMTVMTSGLERASGGRLEQTLEKMTDNVLKAILLGALVTAAIQSSSATTVIVVGLVNARLLKLRQAIGIIMGANIGTTITAHILRLADLEDSSVLMFLKPTVLAPVAAIVGILLYVVAKKKTVKNVGLILIGFCVLFTGMFAMEDAVRPLRDLPQLGELFATLSNPVLGVLVGAGVTALIQSSAASIGILQALTVTGAITASAAFPIILGQNIGTCITPVLSSIGASKGARRTAFVHVSFNVIGTFVFLVAMYAYQYTIGFSFWNDPISKGGIADFHTLFNVLTTLVFIPFTGLLERMAKFFIKESSEELEADHELARLEERFLGSPSFAIGHARESVNRMAVLAKENVQRSIELISEFNPKKLDRVNEVENVIDRLQSKVDQYLLQLSSNELSDADNIALSEVLQVVNEFERIGDHAENICDCAAEIQEKGIAFSDLAMREFNTVAGAVMEILELAVDGYIKRDIDLAHNIEPLEEVIDILIETLKVRHAQRLQDGLCSIESAFPFVEILYNMERISDHCSNVGVHVMSYASGGSVDRHEFLRSLHRTDSPDYREKFEMYDRKYFDPIKQS